MPTDEVIPGNGYQRLCVDVPDETEGGLERSQHLDAVSILDVLGVPGEVLELVVGTRSAALAAAPFFWKPSHRPGGDGRHRDS